jgi:hypothetical protein
VPPTNDETSTNTQTAEPTDEQRAEAEKAEAAAMESSFNEARGEKPADQDKPGITQTDASTTTSANGASEEDAKKAEAEKRAKEEADRQAAEKKAADDAEAKRWEGVAPAVRDFIESQSKATKELEQRVKSTEGRAGAALSGVQALKGAMDAATAASTAGAAAPTKEQIAAATATTEKWKQLKEDFPAWADAMEEQFAAIRADIGKGAGGAVDVEKIKTDVRTEVTRDIGTATAAAVQQARALGRLDAEFGDWETTVNSKPFMAWSYAGGPSATEQSSYFETKRTDPGKASEIFAGFASKYPQWWSEKGSLMASVSPKDASKLLRGYGEHEKAEKAREEAARKKQERLEHAAPATRGGGAPTRTTETEETGFLDGFKAVRAGG